MDGLVRWIPGGGVDAVNKKYGTHSSLLTLMCQGQLFAEAMEREAEEEAGCNVSLQGILRIEHTPAGRGMRSERLRIMYLAAPQVTKPVVVPSPYLSSINVMLHGYA